LVPYHQHQLFSRYHRVSTTYPI